MQVKGLNIGASGSGVLLYLLKKEARGKFFAKAKSKRQRKSAEWFAFCSLPLTSFFKRMPLLSGPQMQTATSVPLSFSKYIMLFIIYFFCLGLTAQVKFDSDDPYWLKNNGLAEVTIYESYKDALKANKNVYKANIINELIGKNAPKLSKLINLQLLNLQNKDRKSVV